MSKATLQDSVAAKIKALYEISQELEALFPGRHYTPDGRLVQIKATQIDRIALSSEPKWLLVLKIHKDGTFSEEYNGPGKLVWEHCGKLQKNGQRPISLAKLRELQAAVPQAERLKRMM